jgi:transposase InsO family protein
MGTDLARSVVDGVLLEGRSLREVALAHGVSKSWVQMLVTRYRTGGYEALAPRSRRPLTSPNRTTVALEEEIVRLRKELADLGADAGAETIHWHLQRRHEQVPSVATIYRILVRRGFVNPQPKKRPKSSFIRFEADLPNECWQSDITFWQLADGTFVEITDIIDDYSRRIIAADVRRVTKAADVLESFHRAYRAYGHPASVLTDNGAVFNAGSRQGKTGFELELESLGIVYKHSRPYHPQTCGKIERWHQTFKRFLAAGDQAITIGELQARVDAVVAYYNNERPHRARGRMTPREAYQGRQLAAPGGISSERHVRVRTDRVDVGGRVSLRYHSRLIHIGIGRAHAGKRLRLYVINEEIRIVTLEGELLGTASIDPKKDYQKMEPA